MKRNVIAILMTGLGVGWLAGLSTSPVIASIIAAVVGAAVATIAVLAGISETDPNDRSGKQRKILAAVPSADLMPLALFVLALAVAAPVGILARTGNWFFAAQPRSPSFVDLVDAWEKAGVERKEAVAGVWAKWKSPPAAPTMSRASAPASLPSAAPAPGNPFSSIFPLPKPEQGGLNTTVPGYWMQ